MQNYINLFLDGLIKGIPNLLTALGIFILALYFARVLNRIVTRVLKRRNAPEGVTQLLAQFAYGTIVVAGIITALQRFFDVTAFLAGLGILGFTVGFALQDVMKNFVAGVILLIQQPFHINEVIGTAGFDGTVLQIDLRSTELKAADGRIVNIPNANILAGPIINYTRADRRLVDLDFRVGYEADTEAAREAVLESIQNIPGVVTEPRPAIAFSKFGDSALEFNTSFWIDTSKTDPGAAKQAAFSSIKNALDKQGIHMPFPIQRVYMHSENQ